MEIKGRVWVDPPSGWLYGFPKIYDPDCGFKIEHWLYREGLPKYLIDLNHCRFWEVPKED